MPIPTQRILDPRSIRRFGRQVSPPLPPLTDLQKRTYERFLQPDTPPEQRIAQGLEGVLREAFPICSHSSVLARPEDGLGGSRSLAYMHYELGPPANSLEECRRLRLTYARPLRVWLRLDGPEPIAEPVHMVAVPIMLDGGEFLINGSERIVIGQLQRAPGIEFSARRDGDLILHSLRIIPQRGPRLEIHVTRRNTLEARLGRGLKLPALTLLRALDPGLSVDRALLGALHPVKSLGLAQSEELTGAISAEDVIDPNTGAVLLEAGFPWTSSLVEQARAGGIVRAVILDGVPDGVLLNSLSEDRSRSHESALVEVYRRMRRGLPIDLDRARQVLAERFTLPTRFTLGAVGRRLINRKLGLSTPLDDLALRGGDLAAAIRCLFDLRAGKGEVDDSEHLANRRVRLLDELLADELRNGLLKLRRVVQDRLQRAGARTSLLRPRELVQHRAVSATLDHFFARSEMSQIVDQTNPLAQLTHARRLTAIGPGGVDRKRARFDVRDIHLSHHGRICPVETPEGEVIGLILHLAMHAGLDEQGFLVTPYHEVVQGRIQKPMTYLRADEEERQCVAPADAPQDNHRITTRRVIARNKGDFVEVAAEVVTHIGVSPQQMVGVSAGLIPFLEHDDANRALMGSNMQRQAVPLLVAEPPIVGTGLETAAARHSSLVVRAETTGVVRQVDAGRIRVDDHDYLLRKFAALNGGTCQNQKPIVKVGETVQAGQVIADGAATRNGELALGRNVLVAFMPWEGYNFEDAVILSERMVERDTFTSIHIEEYEAELRVNRLGEEQFTARVPGPPARALINLDEHGLVRVGSRVLPGDILVGKTVPKGRRELTPEARLLQGVFGRGEERSNDSLEMPAGPAGGSRFASPHGVVIGVEHEKSDAPGADSQIDRARADCGLGPGVRERVRVRIATKRQISVGDKMAGRHGNKGVVSKILPVEDMPYMADGTPVDILLNPLGVPSRMNVGQILETHLGWAAAKLGFKAVTPVFDGASEQDIRECLKEAGLPETGKTYLHDGRTGERFEQPVTVGYIYMLKLHHLVDDKVHARATGPYSLITQQPLGGKARSGGQRLGEMEVWALEAYGASHILQEMLTVKSDDVEGRTRTYEALLRGEELPKPGAPASLEVLRNELRGLGIDLSLEQEE